MTCWNGRVLAPTRRLLVALLLAFSGVVLTQMPAHACRCATQSLDKDAARADVVFSGVLADASSGKQRTVLDVRADTLYKGDLTMSEVEVVSDAGSCTLTDLKADTSYVFFVVEDGGDLVADQCGGTAKASDRFTGKVERLLGPGEALDAPEPEQQAAEFTLVEGAEPETFTRLAAPGAALVLVGLLGLFVVRRRARD